MTKLSVKKRFAFINSSRRDWLSWGNKTFDDVCDKVLRTRDACISKCAIKYSTTGPGKRSPFLDLNRSWILAKNNESSGGSSRTPDWALGVVEWASIT
jgi:hypothetical protein